MDTQLTHRQRHVLAALATQPGASFAPVQVQKMFFLLDRNVSADVGGAQFAFSPYDYGPFDKAVYRELDGLSAHGYVSVDRVSPAAGSRRYSLTSVGEAVGKESLASLSPRTRNYMAEVNAWVRSLSFAQLVGAIYRAYPEMRANSIFVD